MKQVLQHRKTGRVRVVDVPAPALASAGILVRSRASLISAGTEKAALELSQKSLVGMARERPDLVQRVLDKLRREGFWATLNTVRDQLDREVPMGYSVAGEVIAIGQQATEYTVGDLVACAGAGSACHAEVNSVPKLLASKIPAGVTFEQAAYSTVGAIALQGIRNADVRVGETVVVIGLGLIGQLAVMQLHAAGCQVIGWDLSAARTKQALQHGAIAAFTGDSPTDEDAVMELTRSRGADAVLITAATKSNAPVELAARIARDRAKVVMVGVTGMDLPRNDYYHKELTFIVSRSYGPGRYDDAYERQGHDYPAGYVRWTEQRNLEAFLDLVAAGKVRPESLTTHRFPIADATTAYELILSGSEPYLGVLLEYPDAPPAETAPGRIVIRADGGTAAPVTGKIGASFIGAGNFARGVLLRHLKALEGVDLRGVTTSSGHTARSAAERFGFQHCAADIDDVLNDDAAQAVFVCSRHSQHADQVLRAVAAGKAVFVEKPLAVNSDQLAELEDVLADGSPRVMVGFNRRFSPMLRQVKSHFVGTGPLSIHYRCNAGPAPTGHWLADPNEGGRIIGEACHFLDVFGFLTDSRPASVSASHVGGDDPDNVIATITYANGSVCQLSYLTDGARFTSKERLEVFGGGRSALLDDYRLVELHQGTRRTLKKRSFSQDKGHRQELIDFIAAVKSGGPMPIPLESLLSTTRLSLAIVESARTKSFVEL